MFQPKLKKNAHSDILLTIGDINVSQAKVVKFLGIYLDENFSFDYHAKHVCNKLSENLYLLRSIKM